MNFSRESKPHHIFGDFFKTVNCEESLFFFEIVERAIPITRAATRTPLFQRKITARGLSRQ